MLAGWLCCWASWFAASCAKLDGSVSVGCSCSGLAGCGAVLCCCAASCARQALQRTNGRREDAHKVVVKNCVNFLMEFPAAQMHVKYAK